MSKAIAPALTHFPISIRCLFMASMLTVGNAESGANATGRAHRAEQICPVEAPVAQRARAGIAPAPIRVSVPCCPTLASSWNQISTGLPSARAPSASFAKSAKFFEGLLGRWIGLRVLRANGEAAEVQPPKQLAHAALVQGDAKLGRDAVTQIGTAEPHHAVAGGDRRPARPRMQTCLVQPSSGSLAGRFAPGQKAHPDRPHYSGEPSRATSDGPSHRAAPPPRG